MTSRIRSVNRRPHYERTSSAIYCDRADAIPVQLPLKALRRKAPVRAHVARYKTLKSAPVSLNLTKITAKLTNRGMS